MLIAVEVFDGHQGRRSARARGRSVCVQHSDGQCEHTLRLPDSFIVCCTLSDLRLSFVTMSLAQVKTTVRVSPIRHAQTSYFHTVAHLPSHVSDMSSHQRTRVRSSCAIKSLSFISLSSVSLHSFIQFISPPVHLSISTSVHLNISPILYLLSSPSISHLSSLLPRLSPSLSLSLVPQALTWFSFFCPGCFGVLFHSGFISRGATFRC